MATVSMKCPNCGGELIFDPKSQKYKCEYCGSDFALDEISTEEAATQAVSDVVQEVKIPLTITHSKEQQVLKMQQCCIPVRAVGHRS